MACVKAALHALDFCSAGICSDVGTFVSIFTGAYLGQLACFEPRLNMGRTSPPLALWMVVKLNMR